MMGAHLTKSNLVRGERRKGHHYAGDVRTLYRVYNYRTNMNVAAKCPLKWKRRGGGQERHDIFMGGNGSDGKREGGRRKKKERKARGGKRDSFHSPFTPFEPFPLPPFFLLRISSLQEGGNCTPPSPSQLAAIRRLLFLPPLHFCSLVTQQRGKRNPSSPFFSAGGPEGRAFPSSQLSSPVALPFCSVHIFLHALSGIQYVQWYYSSAFASF